MLSYLMLLQIKFPDIKPVLFEIGPISVRWYGLMYMASFIIGYFLLKRAAKRRKLDLSTDDLYDLLFLLILGVMVGGRLGYVLFYDFSAYVKDPISILKIWKGGMSFHGGFTGCVLAVVLFARSRGIPILSLGDVTCAVGPIGLFLGRLANFINGELWGRAADVPWAMAFPTGGPLPRHPSQLYEATLEGLGLLLLLAICIRAGALKRPGLIIGIFAVGYAVARSFCELFREPDVQLGFLWGGLTMGMLLSVPLLLFGIVLIVIALKRPPLHTPQPA